MRYTDVEDVAKSLEDLYNRILKNPNRGIQNLWPEHQEIHRVLKSVTEKQKKFGDGKELLNHPRTVEDLKAFLKWANEKGISHDSVEVECCPVVDGFYLKTRRPIQKGESLVKVPREAMLTSENARDLLKEAIDAAPPMWHGEYPLLALLLLCKKFTNGSDWEPYIKMLPSKFDLPVFYSPDHLESLKPSPLYVSTLRYYRRLALQFCLIFKDVFELYKYDKAKKSHKKNKMKKNGKKSIPPPVLAGTPLTVYNFNFDTWRWASSCILTRVNKVPRINGDGRIPAFIPFLDFANCDLSPVLKDDVLVNLDGRDVGIYVDRDFEAEETVPIFSDHHSNIEYLHRNGVVPEENPNDYYNLVLPIPPAWNYLTKEQFFVNLHNLPSSHKYSFNIFKNDSPIPPLLLCLAKVIVSVDPDVADYDTPENALNAYKYLKQRFEMLHDRYEEKEGTDDFERMVERLKNSEAAILKNAMEFCAGMEQELRDEAAALAGEAAPAVDVEAPVPEAEAAAPEAAGSEAPAPNAGAPDASDADAPTETSEAPSE